MPSHFYVRSLERGTIICLAWIDLQIWLSMCPSPTSMLHSPAYESWLNKQLYRSEEAFNSRKDLQYVDLLLFFIWFKQWTGLSHIYMTLSMMQTLESIPGSPTSPWTARIYLVSLLPVSILAWDFIHFTLLRLFVVFTVDIFVIFREKPSGWDDERAVHIIEHFIAKQTSQSNSGGVLLTFVATKITTEQRLNSLETQEWPSQSS